jgi:WD40 repeat protein
MPKTGACRHVFEGHFGHDAMVTSMVCHPEGDMLLSGSADGTMKLFQLSGKKVLQKFVHSDPSALAQPGSEAAPSVFSRMTTIAEQSSRGGDMDDEDEGGEEETMGAGPETEELSAVECVGFAKGGLKWVASGGMDKNLKVWDMTTGSCRCVCAHGGSVVALKWHDSLPVICTAALDNVIRIWDARNGSLLAELTGHKDLVTNLDLLSVKGVDGSRGITDAIVTVSDDNTSRVFLIDMNSLLA